MGISYSAPATPAVAAAETLITSQVTSGSAANMTFASIPQTYNHLKIIGFFRGGTSSDLSVVSMRFNGDSNGAGHYDWDMTGTALGSGALSTDIQVARVWGNTAAANLFSTFEILIPMYANTTTFKSTLSRSCKVDQTARYTENFSGVWRQTAAITQILLFPESGGGWVDGSTAFLYGIS